MSSSIGSLLIFILVAAAFRSRATVTGKAATAAAEA
jgi:hypothetical protein